MKLPPPAIGSSRAFTLIELLVVILIVAILIAVALPAFLGQTSKAQDSAAQQLLATVRLDAKAIWTADGQAGYPALGPASSPSSLLFQLSSAEPGMALVNGSSPNLNSAGPVEVWYPAASSSAAQNELAMCTQSASSHVFCLLADETTGLTVQDATAPAAATGAVIEADSSPAGATTGRADVSAASDTTIYVSAATESAGRCVINAVSAGQSPSGQCASDTGDFHYSAGGWPSSPGSAGPSAPAFAASPALSTPTPAVGEAVQVSATADGSGTIAYSYQWFACPSALADPLTGGCTAASGSGAASATYTPSSTDAGSYLTVLVTATSPYGQARAYPPAEQVSPGYAATVLTNHPLAFYTLSDTSGTTAADISGNGHAGTYSGAVTLGQPGPAAGWKTAAFSAGGSVRTTLPASAVGLSGSTAYSYEGWVDVAGGASGEIMDFHNVGTYSPTYENVSCYLGSASISCMRSNGTTIHPSVASGTLTAGWHYFAYTYSPADGQILYVDGQQVSNNTASVSLSITQPVLYIGETPDGVVTFTGGLADIAVYSKELSAGSVASDYANAIAP